jgi:hypothetical protein
MNKPEDKITFGKYNGKTFDEIADVEPDYILWLDKNVKTIKLPKSFVDAVEMEIRERDNILLEHQFDIY